MKLYRIFKLITIVLFALGFAFELYLLIDAGASAIDNRSLTGGGRAQSEFFMMGMFFIGKPIGYLGLTLWIANLLVDLFYSGSKFKRNELIYIGLTLMTLIPFMLDDLLLTLMYSGWK